MILGVPHPPMSVSVTRGDSTSVVPDSSIEYDAVKKVTCIHNKCMSGLRPTTTNCITEQIQDTIYPCFPIFSWSETCTVLWKDRWTIPLVAGILAVCHLFQWSQNETLTVHFKVSLKVKEMKTIYRGWGSLKAMCDSEREDIRNTKGWQRPMILRCQGYEKKSVMSVKTFG